MLAIAAVPFGVNIFLGGIEMKKIFLVILFAVMVLACASKEADKKMEKKITVKHEAAVVLTDVQMLYATGGNPRIAYPVNIASMQCISILENNRLPNLTKGDVILVDVDTEFVECPSHVNFVGILKKDVTAMKKQ